MARKVPCTAPTFVGVVLGAVAGLVAMACGSMAGPGQAASQSQPPSRPSASASPFSPSANRSMITFVVRQGADPQTVGHRIGGLSATVRRAYPRPPRENFPMNTVVRTFVVTVPQGQEQAALQGAGADPDVQLAWFGTYLGA